MPSFSLPAEIGIGLKPVHYDQILTLDHGLGWFEIHPENYMGEGGLPHKYLNEIRQQHSLSMHGVGMSLGSAEGVDQAHLDRLKALVDRYEPHQVSEHVAWSHGMGVFHNDLLPVPYTEDSLEVICNNIDRVQGYLGRQILVENPSSYLSFEDSSMTEVEYITEMQKRSGCGLLLDINNVYVSAHNNQFDAQSYLDDYPLDAVGEIHLAGHAVTEKDGNRLLIDDHGSVVTDDVWDLHAYALEKLARPVPVLIEWDTNVPDFDDMLEEAAKARVIQVQGQRPEHSALEASA